MATLIIPGRHVITSAFMTSYLDKVLSAPLSDLEILGEWRDVSQTIDHIIFPITSANQHGSRYNPVPLYARVIGLDRTVAPLRNAYNVRVSFIPVPHLGYNADFAGMTLKYIETHLGSIPEPSETLVWCSTKSLITQYQQHGYPVLPAEWDVTKEEYSIEPPTAIIEALVAYEGDYKNAPAYHLLSAATQTLWTDMPEIPEHLFRLWRDPILTESGSLTETRNYGIYAVGMAQSALLDIKFNDVKEAIVEGKIVDEGCADGALMVRLAHTFPDSDIIGIDITGEFVSRVEERQRAGEFGNSFVHVYQRNILEPIFQKNSIHTTLCNSTLHELWSYGSQEISVRRYLRDKYAQLASGGRLIIRDVVGPEHKEEIVYLKLSTLDGENIAPDAVAALCAADTSALSTESRFFRFAHDFLLDLREAGRRKPDTQLKYAIEMIDGSQYIKLRLKDAVEYLSRKDYHDNWKSEMNEEFAFWDIEEWKKELGTAGFTIVHQDSEGPTFSGAYTNQWIVQNRLQPCATLWKKVGSTLLQLPYPVTNMVLVGEK